MGAVATTPRKFSPLLLLLLVLLSFSYRCLADGPFSRFHHHHHGGGEKNETHGKDASSVGAVDGGGGGGEKGHHLRGVSRLASAYRTKRRRSEATEVVHDIMHTVVGKIKSDNIIKGCLIAVNVTTFLVEQAVASIDTTNRSTEDVQDEIMSSMSVVADDVEALARVVLRNRIFKRFVPKQLPGIIQDLVDAGAVPRLILSVAAAVLHDWAPRDDPCVALLVVAFATGSLTKQLASNLLSSLESELADHASYTGIIGGAILSDALSDLWHTVDDDGDVGGHEKERRIGERLFRIFRVLGGGGGGGVVGGAQVMLVGRKSKQGAALMAIVKVVRAVRRVRWRPLLAAVTAAVAPCCVVMIRHHRLHHHHDRSSGGRWWRR